MPNDVCINCAKKNEEKIEANREHFFFQSFDVFAQNGHRRYTYVCEREKERERKR